MRTLKEQQHQLLSLKFRAENTFLKIFLEAGLGGFLTYALLQLHWAFASMMGAFAILGVYSWIKKWAVHRYEYRTFKKQYDAMMLRGRIQGYMDDITD